MARSERNQPRNATAHVQTGFTLLEVMVALTITGLALGALFSVIGGNKRLAWTAEAALVRSMQARSLLNLVQLNDEQGEVFLAQDNEALQLETGMELDKPARETMSMIGALRGFDIVDESGEVVYRGTYWIKQSLPAGTQGNGAEVQGPFGPVGIDPGERDTLNRNPRSGSPQGRSQ